MKTIISILISIFSIFAVSNNAVAEELQVEERIGLDPVLVGVWVGHSFSGDGGKTIQPLIPPTPFATVTRSTVKLADGDLLSVKKVMMLNVNGEPANAIMLSNGVMLVAIKPDGQRMILVQVFRNDKEVMRTVITVE